MAAVDPMAFSPWAVMATQSRTSHAASSSNLCATASEPPASTPADISTKPPKIERAADPEPRRASAESSAGDNLKPAAREAARARAAKPAADEARPAAVGTLLRVATSAGMRMPARARTRSRKPRTRAANFCSAGAPANSTRSRPSATPASGAKRTVVSRPRFARVRDRLPAAGRLSAASRLPQYLTSAMLVPARTVTDFRREFSVMADGGGEPVVTLGAPAAQELVAVLDRDGDNRAATACAGQLGAQCTRGPGGMNKIVERGGGDAQARQKSVRHVEHARQSGDVAFRQGVHARARGRPWRRPGVARQVYLHKDPPRSQRGRPYRGTGRKVQCTVRRAP